MITAPMITDKLQQIQDDEYTFPYHYVSQFENNFTQCFNDIWGINYIATIEFMLGRLAATPFESLVDVGCGDGRLTYEIQKRFPARTVWGIDYSQRAINLAKAMNPRGNYLQADITQPSTLSAFDAAVLMEVFEHIPPAAAPAFLGGVAGLLKQNGVLFITVPHVNKPVEYKHFRHFSLHSLLDAVADHFTVAETVFFENNDWRKDFIDGLLTNRFFILNSNRLKTMLYSYYKKHLFYVDHEKGCKRLFMKLIRK